MLTHLGVANRVRQGLKHRALAPQKLGRADWVFQALGQLRRGLENLSLNHGTGIGFQDAQSRLIIASRIVHPLFQGRDIR